MGSDHLWGGIAWFYHLGVLKKEKGANGKVIDERSKVKGRKEEYKSLLERRVNPVSRGFCDLPSRDD
jgi:hypothetical protein